MAVAGVALFFAVEAGVFLDYDARTKNGIGSHTPRDEKSQETGSLVGNLDYNLLPRFESESHPLVHDYKGELWRALSISFSRPTTRLSKVYGKSDSSDATASGEPSGIPPWRAVRDKGGDCL